MSLSSSSSSFLTSSSPPLSLSSSSSSLLLSLSSPSLSLSSSSLSSSSSLLLSSLEQQQKAGLGTHYLSLLNMLLSTKNMVHTILRIGNKKMTIYTNLNIQIVNNVSKAIYEKRKLLIHKLKELRTAGLFAYLSVGLVCLNFFILHLHNTILKIKQ